MLFRSKGAPKSITGDFSCKYNNLISLEGAPKVSGDFYIGGNPCSRIYIDWINTDKRNYLLEMVEDYDFLRGNEIIWDRLEMFFLDNNLNLPNQEELKRYYTII